MQRNTVVPLRPAVALFVVTRVACPCSGLYYEWQVTWNGELAEGSPGAANYE